MYLMSGSLRLLCPSVFLVESKRDILFLFDGSVNVLGQFPAVRDFLYRIIEELDVKPDGTRVAIAQFSDDVRLESRFSEHQTKAEILNLVKKMKLKTGKALNLGYALDYALRNIFVRSAGSRIEDNVQQFLVLLVAGRSSDAVAGPASSLKQRGVVPFIFQAKNANPSELEQIVLSPAFILAAESLPKIGDLQSQIVSLLKAEQGSGPVSGMVHQAAPQTPCPPALTPCIPVSSFKSLAEAAGSRLLDETLLPELT
jgi:collagen type VI alpha